MISKKKLLKDSRLYLVLDRKVCLRPLSFLKGLITLGVDIVQLRDKISSKSSVLKQARRIGSLLNRSSSIFLLNDYVDIAGIVGADGVHLGQDDLPVSIARKILGKDKIIGVSCHSLKGALSAQEQGADYVSMGPVFATNTKPDYAPQGTGLLRKAAKAIKIPFFGIGGINLSNLDGVLRTGASRIAVCSLLCKQKNIPDITRTLKAINDKFIEHDTIRIRKGK